VSRTNRTRVCVLTKEIKWTNNQETREKNQGTRGERNREEKRLEDVEGKL
jgi:hypothetical protein